MFINQERTKAIVYTVPTMTLRNTEAFGFREKLWQLLRCFDLKYLKTHFCSIKRQQTYIVGDGMPYDVPHYFRLTNGMKSKYTAFACSTMIRCVFMCKVCAVWNQVLECSKNRKNCFCLRPPHSKNGENRCSKKREPSKLLTFCYYVPALYGRYDFSIRVGKLVVKGRFEFGCYVELRYRRWFVL